MARVQFLKYGELFNVIVMDPPWKIRMNLRYPLLTMTQIFGIPFELL